MRLVMMLGFRASCCPLATRASVGKKVPSVALRPARPNWKSIVGVQSPKSAPARLVVELAVEFAAEDAVELAAAAAFAFAFALAALALQPELELELELLAAAAAEPVELLAADPAEPFAAAGVLLPLASTMVKLLKPWATMTSATDKPVAAKGVAKEELELAFSKADPVTAGSMRGTIPRSSAVAGRVASPQMEGMSTLKGLKFCSAATTAAAPLMTAGSVPRVVTILSARVSCELLVRTAMDLKTRLVN